MTRFRVCGTREVLGHAPGEEFEADISDIQEWRLTVGGHIERVVDVEEREEREELEQEHDEPGASAGDDHEKE